MKKRLFCLILGLVILLPMAPAVMALDGGYSEYTADELLSMTEICEQNKATAHEMAECARRLGYAEGCEIIRTAQSRWRQEQEARRALQRELEALREKEAAYPYAWEVWQSLEKEGYHPCVIAGILGNMMAECGGQTLALRPFLFSDGYYGLCMWSLYYNPAVSGLDLPGQMRYLQSTIRENMDAFGGAGTYERFCALRDEREAARYFNAYYERGSGTAVRQDNAAAALRYFMKGEE